MKDRDLAVVAGTLAVFAVVARLYDPVAGIAVAAAIAFFLVASFRYREIRW